MGEATMSKSEMARLEHQCNKLMVYGILKRGFDLDLTKRGCKLLGECQLSGANLYGLGYKDATGSWTGVGLRLVEDPNRVAQGELFEIPERGAYSKDGFMSYSDTWRWLDSIEQNGHCYTRKIVEIKPTGQCFNCALDGYTNDDEYGGGCYCPEGPCCSKCHESVKAWVYEHTFPGYKYVNLIENGRF